MVFKTYYDSPVGKMILVGKDNALIGLWLEGQKYYLGGLKEELIENNNLNIFIKTKKWLDKYFRGEQPSISSLNLSPIGSDFRQTVWDILCQIPYGKVTTYKEIAQKVAKKMNRKTMSAQAVGGAIGHNPIIIIIPCHRVVGTDGSLTGYAGGIEIKKRLLQLENIKDKAIMKNRS